MSLDVTDTVIPKEVLEGMAFRGRGIIVRKFTKKESVQPNELIGMTLVGFGKKMKHYTKFSQKSLNTGDILDDLAEHSKLTGIDTDGCVAVGVYRANGDSEKLTCSIDCNNNELMGIAYMPKELIDKRCNADFNAQDAINLLTDMNTALMNLKAWYLGKIYQITFMEGGVEVLKSKVYYNIKKTEELISNLFDTLEP